MIGDFEFLYGNKTKADLSADAATDVFGGEIGNLIYIGDWDASTNTPELIDGEGEDGNYYIVVVEGVADLGSGPINFLVGNIVKYSSDLGVWTMSALINEKVATVNGQIGNVVLGTDEIAEGDDNLYWTNVRFDERYTSSFGNSDTDGLSEGLSNLYWTTNRGDENFSNNLEGSNTDSLSEGSSNLYWTNARFDERYNSSIVNTSIGALSNVDITTTEPEIGELLVWNGTNYIPIPDAGSVLTEIAVTSVANISNGESRIPSMVLITQANYDLIEEIDPLKMYVIRG